MEATVALPHLATGREEGFGEGPDLFLRLPQQVQRESLSGPGPDARQSLETIDQSCQGAGEAAQGSTAVG